MASCTGVVDHGGQVFAVSPVAENQSVMRAVACRWWESIQETLPSTCMSLFGMAGSRW